MDLNLVSRIRSKSVKVTKTTHVICKQSESGFSFWMNHDHLFLSQLQQQLL